MKNTQKTFKNVKKSHFFAKNRVICAIFVFIFFLAGCAKKDPVDTIVDHHHEHIGEVLDYAYNNIDQNSDVVFLENELKSCDLALIDLQQTYYGQISACKAETKYWRLATGGLLVALCMAIFAIIKRWFK